jgi:hypothetical protein
VPRTWPHALFTEIIKVLALQIGDKVAVSLKDKETPQATPRPVRSVADPSFGAIQPRRQPDEPDRLREQFAEAAQERDQLSKQQN